MRPTLNHWDEPSIARSSSVSPCWAPVIWAVSSFIITVLSSSAPGTSSPMTPPSAARGMARNTDRDQEPVGRGVDERAGPRDRPQADRRRARRRRRRAGLLGGRERRPPRTRVDLLQVEDHGDVVETADRRDRGALRPWRRRSRMTAASTAAPPAPWRARRRRARRRRRAPGAAIGTGGGYAA